MRLLKAVGAAVGILILGLAAAVGWLALRSPASRPPTTEKIEATPARLARGAYLAEHVADCFGCHSDHLSDRFGLPIRPGTKGQGGFVFDEKAGVPGILCAQNITPDNEAGLGNWSDGEVLRAMREGIDRKGRALFPMMPYPAFLQMSDEDAKSIVVYLRTLPAVRHSVPAKKINFPVNLFIKSVPKPVDGPVTAPQDAQDHHAYGKYLVRIAGCVNCHTPHDSHGKPIPGQEFSGGWTMLGPWGRVVSANITPEEKTWLGKANKAEFVGRFKAFASFDALNSPPADKGRNTVMPWLAFSGMTEQDLGAIYDYLKTIRPIRREVVPFPDAPPAQPAIH
jgi:mono/diheme cytochrome c family protein